MDLRGFVTVAILSGVSFQAGCGTAQPVVADSVATQPVSDPSTGISAGIYSGKVTCQSNDVVAFNIILPIKMCN